VSDRPQDSCTTEGRSIGPQGPGARLSKVRLRGLLQMKEIGVLSAFVGVCFLLGLLSPYFFTTRNLFNVVRQISVVGVMTIGCTILMAAGEVDLSVGQVLGLSAAAMATLMRHGVPPWPSLVGALAIGAAMGVVNGLIVTKLRVNSLITTLGTLSVARGFALLLTGGLPLSMPETLTFLGRGYIGQVPIPGILLLFFAVVAHLFLSRTVMGRQIYAVGSNPRAARLSGISVEGIKRLAFVAQGLCAAVGGIIMSGNLSMADPVMGQGMELDVIAAAVIGGASLSGGAGTVLGSILGAGLMGVLRNGFVLLGVSTFWQVVTIGVVIILAVAIDQLRRR
jgi:ribose transport system permease protein